MQSFVAKHADKITGVLSCFDRVILRGYLPFCHAMALEGFLNHHNILLKNFKTFAPQQAERLKAHAQAFAQQAGRPYQYLAKRTRKEELARRIAQADGVSAGLIAVFATLETCRSFRVAYGHGRPYLKSDFRRCLVVYYYFLHPEFGFSHLKIETWFPFTMQVYVNGHEWLARQLDKKSIPYQRLDNAFVALPQAEAAQRLAEQFCRLKWPRLLSRWAQQINPLFADLLKGLSYYWVVDQAEFASDILFHDRAALHQLYPRLLQHATLCFSAEDVLTFLGRKLSAAFAGEIINDCKMRWPAARVKHRMKENWLKMYDKHGRVLRIETVINRPREFRVRRWSVRRGQDVLAWFPLTKGVRYLWRYAEVSQQANARYLEALAVVDDPSRATRLLDQVCRRSNYCGRTRRALNPLNPEEQRLFVAVLRGEHALHGFANRDVAAHLVARLPLQPADKRRLSTRVSRLLQLLRAHGLIAKIPRSRRYRVTGKGNAVMSTAIYLRYKGYPKEIGEAA